MRFKINVSQKHIDRGITRRCGDCPLALAIKDAGFDYVGVTARDCAIGRFTFPLTKRMKKFVDDFDNGVTVAPCTFTWNIPKEAMPKAVRK